MANGHGGARTPAQPAAVSGPGNLSRRTDGGPGAKSAPIQSLPNPNYGEGQEFRSIQQGAPIAQAQKPNPASPGGAPVSVSPPPLDAPSTRGGEPITAGVDAGAGPGSDSLGLFDPSSMAADDIRYALKYLPTLQYIVDSSPNAAPSTRALVKYLRSQR